jgi:O-antigen/teichoic acid export membrane protein
VTPVDNQPQPAGTPAANTGRRVMINTSSLASANLFRIGLSFVLQLMVARTLGIAGLGQYATLLAILHVCQVICEFGLPTLLARDLAQRPAQRRGVYHLALLVQICLALVIWIALSLLILLLPPAERGALWLAGMSLPFYAVMSASEALFEACERMELELAVELCTNLVLFAACALILVRGGQVIDLMAAGVVVQALSALISVVIVAWARLLAQPQDRPSLDAFSLLRRARPFFGLALIDVLQQRSDLLLLGLFAGPALTGIYVAANSVVRVIIKLVQSFWRALYPTLSRLYAHRHEQFVVLYSMALRIGWTGVSLVAALVAGLAQNVIVQLFGASFVPAASVLAILVWSAPLYLIESFAISLLFIQRRPRQSLSIGLIHLLVVVVCLPIGVVVAGADGAAIASVLAAVLGALVGLRLLHPLLPMALIRTLLLTLFAACTASLIAWWLRESAMLAFLSASGCFLLLVGVAGSITRSDAALLRRSLKL